MQVEHGQRSKCKKKSLAKSQVEAEKQRWILSLFNMHVCLLSACVFRNRENWYYTFCCTKNHLLFALSLTEDGFSIGDMLRLSACVRLLQRNDCVWLISKLLLAAEHLLDLCRLNLLYPGLTPSDAFKQLKPIPWRQLLVFYTGQQSGLTKTCRSGPTF